MSTLTSPDLTPIRTARERRTKLNDFDRRSNVALKVLVYAGGGLLFLGLAAIVYLIVSGANESFGKYGLGFIFHTTWIPTVAVQQFGAWSFIYGSLVTAVCSTILSAIIGVSIGVFLALIASPRVSNIIGPMVELLAAVPSVILGLIGIAVICPFVASTLEPPLHAVLGWTGLFGSPENAGNSLFAAILILTIMVVPIVAALSRDLIATVPIELRDGAEALGATRWEMVRSIVLPTTRSGIIAAVMLGFGRAVGEAIAVEQVVGGNDQVKADLFQGGNTIAANVASQFESPQSTLHTSSLYYLLAILLVIVLATILMARFIAGDFGKFEVGRASLARARTGLFGKDIA